MTKMLKGLLLLSIFAFIISCQAKTVGSEFEVVKEDTQLSPDFIHPPVDDDIPPPKPGEPTPTITPLTTEELSIANADAFNRYINSGNISQGSSRFIDFKISGNRINETTFLDIKKTHVVASFRIVERSKGSDLNKLIEGLKVIKYADGKMNSYSIYMNNTKLAEALPKVDTYAKVLVEVYVKDLRTYSKEDAEKLQSTGVTPDKKQYAVTQRSFEFIVKRTE